MRGLRLTARAGNGARLDGRKAKLAIVIGGNAAISREVRFQGLFLRVFRMSVFAVRVGLPDFNHSIGYGLAVAVKHLAFDRQSLAGHSLARPVVGAETVQANAKKWSDRLRGCGRNMHVTSPSEWRRRLS